MSKIILVVAILLQISVVSAASGYRIETLVEDLEYPHGIAFLPNGDLLITEKPGRLRVISGNVLQPKPVSGVPKVHFDHYSGLLDIALHPRFSENRLVYLSLIQRAGKLSTLHIVRGRYEDGRLSDVINIFTVEQVKKNAIFFGARMAFLPDDSLLFTVGDGYDTREEAQNLNNELGKIIRLKDDGGIPENNPFVGKSNIKRAIWSYGHRNVLGIMYDSVTETVYAHDNGPWGGDELNIIESGKNYGWPFASYGKDYSGALVTPFKVYPNTEEPILQWTPSLAPSGITQCRNCQWDDWEGDLFIGMLAGRQVRRIRLQDNVVVEQEVLFANLNERIRDLRFSPAGELYLLTDGDKGRLLKVITK